MKRRTVVSRVSPPGCEVMRTAGQRTGPVVAKRCLRPIWGPLEEGWDDAFIYRRADGYDIGDGYSWTTDRSTIEECIADISEPVVIEVIRVLVIERQLETLKPRHWTDDDDDED